MTYAPEERPAPAIRLPSLRWRAVLASAAGASSARTARAAMRTRGIKGLQTAEAGEGSGAAAGLVAVRTPAILEAGMGTVVKLEKPRRERSTGPKPPRRRPRRSRTALVLGGGGVTGGVYEIGALRALDLLAVNRTVNQFDVYVGTSAGAFVGSLAANGVTPEEMMRVVNQQVPTPFRDIDVGTLLRPNYADFAKAAALMPLRAVGVMRELAANVTNVGLMDLVFGLAEGLPSGMYSSDDVERCLREVLSHPSPSSQFRELENELYLTATDLDTC